MKNKNPLLRVIGLSMAATSLANAQTTRDFGLGSDTTIPSTPGTYTWNTTANWSADNVPGDEFTADPQVVENAYFNDKTVTPFAAGIWNLTLDSAITLGQLRIGRLNAPSLTQFMLSGADITLNDPTGTNYALLYAARPTGTVTVENTIANNLILADEQGVQASGGFTLNLTGNISGSSQLWVNGSVVLNLSGANTWSGGLRMTNGTTQVTTAAALSDVTGTFSLGADASSAATVILRTNDTTQDTVIDNDLDFNNASNATTQRTITLTAAGGRRLEFSTNNIANAGAGSQALSHTITVNRGTGSGPGIVKFSGTGFVIGKAVLGASTSCLEFAPASGVQTWNGAITNFTSTGVDSSGVPYGILKTGAGTTVLAGANAYYGQTKINAGTLQLNGSHVETVAQNLQAPAGLPVGRFAVTNGGTLGGTGRIAVFSTTNSATNGAVVVADGGTIAPGASIGTLTLDGVNMTGATTPVLNMNAGAKFHFELDGSGGTPDRIDFWNYAVTDLLLNGNVVDLSLVGTPVAGTYEVEIMRFFSDAGTTPTASEISSGLALPDPLPAGITSADIIYGTNSIKLSYTIGNDTVTAYDDWADDFPGFSPTTPALDFDNDGLSNLLEFVLGGNPTLSQAGISPVVSASGSDLVVTFKRSDASEADVAVVVQLSADLSTWNPADDILVGADNGSSDPEVSVNEDGANPDMITVTIPKAAAARKFARIKATKAP